MKTPIIALLAFVCLLQAIRAYPLEEIEAGVLRESIQPESEHIRVKRVTCDVLSFEAKGIKVNDAACATHCLIRGRRGGYCNGQKVCVCR